MFKLVIWIEGIIKNKWALVLLDLEKTGKKLRGFEDQGLNCKKIIHG